MHAKPSVWRAALLCELGTLDPMIRPNTVILRVWWVLNFEYRSVTPDNVFEFVQKRNSPAPLHPFICRTAICNDAVFSIILGCRGLLYGYKFLDCLRDRCTVDFDTWYPFPDNRAASFRTPCPRLPLAFEQTIFACPWALSKRSWRPREPQAAGWIALYFFKIHLLNNASTVVH